MGRREGGHGPSMKKLGEDLGGPVNENRMEGKRWDEP